MVTDYITVHIWQNYRQAYSFVGTLLLDGERENGTVSFQYDSIYVQNGGAALDPKNLPTTLPKLLYAVPTGNGELPAYFTQFLPGAYAQVMLQKADPQWHQLDPFNKLKAMTNCFGDHGAIMLDPHLEQNNGLVSSSSNASELVNLLTNLKCETSQPLINTQLLALLSIAGHKPKFDYVDESEGKRYVGKLDVSSFFDEVKMRSVFETLSRTAGIETLQIKNEILPSISNVTLQQNFKHDFVEHEGRSMLLKYNCVSFEVLSGTSHEVTGIQQFTYAHAAKIIDRFSVEPEIDKQQLLLRAVFSATFNHTSNGMENLALIDYERDQWRLAPACNILPNPAEEQAFELSYDNHLTASIHFTADLNFAIHVAKTLNMSPDDAKLCYSAIQTAVSSLESVCTDINLCEDDYKILKTLVSEPLNIRNETNSSFPSLG